MMEPPFTFTPDEPVTCVVVARAYVVGQENSVYE